MTTADIAVLTIIALSALLAFARGFVREILSIFGWVGATIVAFYAFPIARPFLRQYITVPLAADIITGVAIFVIALIILSTVGHYIAQAVRGTAMNAVDRSLGFIFGVARGAVLVVLAYMLVVWTFPQSLESPWLRDAQSRPWVDQGAMLVRALVPEETIADTAERAEEARERVERGAEAADRLRELSTPQPAPNKDASDTEPVYNEGSREQLERLIENAR
ncbi:MAG: CvpA family protein [Inquilinaceae bacterium]